MRYDENDKVRILEATDLFRLIGEAISLKKKGREYVGLCPFHDDKSPSMFVNSSKGIYKCFSCGAGGDALKWMTEYHRMTFPEALKFLAERAGITLTPARRFDQSGSYTNSGHHSNDADEHGLQGFGEQTQGISRTDIAMANGVANDFFKLILKHPEHGRQAQEIIQRRGISAEMVEKFFIGAAPDRWDGLVSLIDRKKLSISAFAAAGLVKNRDSGGVYDAMRNRLIFPITDTVGRVIAFGGRKIKEEDEPKYLNSPETLLFNKSATLYGMPQALPTIRAEKLAIIVEGYMDCVACHQAGVCNVVATLGTALTTQSARLLARVCDTVVLLFDGDQAGQRAADRAVEVLFDSTLEVKLATMTSAQALGFHAKDPDDLVKRPGGVDALRKLIAQSSDALEFRFERLQSQLKGSNTQQRAKIVEEELQRLGELGLTRISPVQQQLLCRRVDQLLGLEAGTALKTARASAKRAADRAAIRENNRPSQPPSSGPPARSSTSSDKLTSTKPSSASELALSYALSEPSLLANLDSSLRCILAPESFENPTFAALAKALWTLVDAGQRVTVAQLDNLLDDQQLKDVAISLIAESQRFFDQDHAAFSQAFMELLAQIQAQHARVQSEQQTTLAEQLAKLRAAKPTRGS